MTDITELYTFRQYNQLNRYDLPVEQSVNRRKDSAWFNRRLERLKQFGHAQPGSSLRSKHIGSRDVVRWVLAA